MAESGVLRDSKTDMMSSKNLDMKQRRVVNAADAVDPQDYITLEQQTTLENTLTTAISNIKADGKTGNFKLLGTDGNTYTCTFTNGILTKIVL